MLVGLMLGVDPIISLTANFVSFRCPTICVFTSIPETTPMLAQQKHSSLTFLDEGRFPSIECFSVKGADTRQRHHSRFIGARYKFMASGVNPIGDGLLKPEFPCSLKTFNDLVKDGLPPCKAGVYRTLRHGVVDTVISYGVGITMSIRSKVPDYSQEHALNIAIGIPVVVIGVAVESTLQEASRPTEVGHGVDVVAPITPDDAEGLGDEGNIPALEGLEP